LTLHRAAAQDRPAAAANAKNHASNPSGVNVRALRVLRVQPQPNMVDIGPPNIGSRQIEIVQKDNLGQFILSEIEQS
jgi:hypothetical protein